MSKKRTILQTKWYSLPNSSSSSYYVVSYGVKVLSICHSPNPKIRVWVKNSFHKNFGFSMTLGYPWAGYKQLMMMKNENSLDPQARTHDVHIGTKSPWMCHMNSRKSIWDLKFVLLSCLDLSDFLVLVKCSRALSESDLKILRETLFLILQRPNSV